MSPGRRRALLILLAAGALTLLLAPDALASAGGGSSGFSGGGGGGGGGHGGFALYLIFDLLIHIALLGHGLGAIVLAAIAIGYLFFTRVLPRMSDDWQERAAGRRPRRRRRGPSQRERRVELAAAEAAESDPAWGADEVRAAAGRLFSEIQVAWDRGDRARLHTLVGGHLVGEWDRRLDDFERRGWSNHVEVLGEPSVELVGLTHRGDEATDHAVVRIDARMKDYVVDRSGRRLKRNGRLGETTRVREFWSLGRRHGAWKLISIEQNREGTHALDEQIVATPWADDRGLRDTALVEGAVADAVPEGTRVGEVAGLRTRGTRRAPPTTSASPTAASRPTSSRSPRAARSTPGRPRSTVPRGAGRDRDPEGQARAAPCRRHERVAAARRARPGRPADSDRRPRRERRAADDDDRGRHLRPPVCGEPRHRGRRRGQPHAHAELHRALDARLTDDERQPWRITSAGAPVGLA